MKPWLLILCTINTATAVWWLDRETEWQLQDRLIAPERQRRSDRLGRAVAIFRETIVVGAYWDSSPETSYLGAVHVYTPGERFYQHDVWKHRAKVTSRDVSPLDQYGSALDLHGNTLVVGVPFLDGDAGTDQGGVFVYQSNDPKVWVEQPLLRASNAKSDDQFGVSVAIYENTLVVGAPMSNPSNVNNAGAAYVFQKGGDVWTETTILTPSDSAADDFFGGSVSIHDDIIVVGARGKDMTVTDSGAVYVFTRDALNVWTEETMLTATTENHGYGVATATDGTTIVVGAIRDGTLGTNAGAVYVYSRNNGDWTLNAKLVAGDGTAGDQFGIAVAVDGNLIVVGAHFDDVADLSNVGSAYVFRKVNGFWSEERKLTACDRSPGDGYGFSVDVDRDQIVVGSFASDIMHHFGRDAGVGYVYKYDRKRRRLRSRRCRRRNSDGN
ncbi:hypothetical protein FisN_8Hh225 [Fistulifera solaris]|uniref:Uncharacterized protein n=1 Tax=Fistulifera solaris TaxID=1519565 RepID=A0A1Z5JYB9_FISSO|nr:hypothetical protein FisN_8Hh225 [Fistulifera solaris]|eukprot:GAX19004.1 hypothetical protein FisN_8Hh225 [Fistulifera solaris]